MHCCPKGKIIVLVLLMLLTAIPNARASDYQAIALDYLAEKLAVPAGDIVLEGMLQDFPQIGEQFWIGRYYLAGGAGTNSAPDTGQETPRILPDDAPGRQSSAGAVEPAAPQGGAGRPQLPPDKGIDAPATGTIVAGSVVIRVQTSEIMAYEEALPFFEEEWRLEQEEWERLSKEAGKITVELSKKLADASPDTIFAVIIWPRYVETEAMRAAMEEVYDQCPELHAPRPAIEADILPAPAPDTVNASGDTGSAFCRVPDGNAYSAPADRRALEEMYRQLEQIRLQGYESSLAAIEQALREMDAAYESDSTTVRSALTPAQILSLKNADYLESITEEGYCYAMDGDMAGAAEVAPLNAPLNTGADAAGRSLWLIPALLIIPAAACATIFCYRRKVRG